MENSPKTAMTVLGLHKGSDIRKEESDNARIL